MKRSLMRWMAPVLALLLCCGAALAGPWVTVTGSSWNTPVNVSVKLGGGLGEFRWNNVASAFDFGPQGTIGRHVFSWVYNEDLSTGELWGTFKPEKDCIKLTVSTMMLNTIIKECIQVASGDAGSALKSLSIKVKRVNELCCLTGRDQNGAWLKLKVRIEFNYSFKRNGKSYKGTGTYSAQGTGRRA